MVADILSVACYVVQQLATVNTKENAIYYSDVLCSTDGLLAHFVSQNLTLPLLFLSRNLSYSPKVY